MSRITLSRSRSVEESRAVALLRLDQYEFKQGEPVVIYYRDGDNVDYIYAIGTGEGKGWYKIITTGQQTIIWSVETSLPDISTLIHGEVRLYNDENGDWYTVRAIEDETTGDTTRQIRILSSVPKIFINIQDNSIWVSDEDRKARRINSIYTKEEINELLSEIKSITLGDFSEVAEKADRAYAMSTEARRDVIDLTQRVDAAEGEVDIISEKVDDILPIGLDELEEVLV